MKTTKANNIVTVPENVTIPENPAPVKVDAPKVTAKREMTVKTDNTVTVPSISFDTLLALGIVEKNSVGEYNATKAADAARDYLKDANSALASKISDDSLAVLLASVGQNTEAVRRAGKKVALAMALVDANETYKEYGYKSTSALFRALYPSLADSTVWNYINTGKEIYIPAQAKNAPAYLKDIAELEPGTALSAVGVLRDKEALKRFPAALKKAKEEKNSNRITQTILKAAAKAARNPETKKKEDGTAGTDKKDDKAQSDVNRQEKRAVLETGLRMWIQRGIYNSDTEETPFTVSDDCKKEGINYLKNAIKNGDADIVLEIMIDFFMK